MIRVLQHGLEGMRTYAIDADFAGGRIPDLDNIRKWTWIGFDKPPTDKIELGGYYVQWLFRDSLGRLLGTLDMRTIWVVDYDASTVTRVVFRP